MDTPQLTQEELNALIDEAHALKRKVAAHAHGAEAAKRAVRAGVDSIEHGSFLDDEALDMMKQHGTYYVPTLMALQGLSEQMEAGMYIPPAIRAKAELAMTSLHKTFQKALAKGVKIGLGTDAAVYPHGRNAEEFHQMVDLGMKPIDALKAGTSADADLLGLADKIGTLEAGKDRRHCGRARQSGRKYPADGTCRFRDERRRGLQRRARCGTLTRRDSGGAALRPSQLESRESWMTVSPETTSPPNPRSSSGRDWLLALVVSLATALAIISPYFWKGNASGHDFSFHAASWMDAAAQWRDGILYPRWADGANFGFGEPRFIFYPPLSWMFGAALSFVVPWLYVPAVFIVLTQTMAGLSAFALGRRLFPQRGALLCAVCYAANPYALLIVYMRSDFAEQLALVFFPVLILATLEATGAVQTSLGTPRRIVFLAIVFAAVWLTNAPAGVIASYGLTVFFIWRAMATKSCRPLLNGSAGLALGFGLIGFYLLPAAYEQRWVNISQALASGLQPAQNFLYAMIADEEHNAFNRVASGAAVLMMALTAIFACIAFPRDKKTRSEPVTRAVWSTLLVLAVTAAFMMLRVSGIFWTLLPKLRFVQFPWRWMSLLAIPFACFIAATIARKTMRRYWAVLLAAVLVAVLGCTATWMVSRTWWDSEDIPLLREAIDHDEGFEGVDEYDPKGDDHTDLPEKSARIKLLNAAQKAAAAQQLRIHVERWSAERKEIRVTTREPIRVALRILNYPAWRVEVNDAVVIPEQTKENNEMVVPLAAGSSHVVVRFTRTSDRTAGAAVTLASMLIAVLLFFASRERT